VTDTAGSFIRGYLAWGLLISPYDLWLFCIISAFRIRSHHYFNLFGAFEKLWKITINFVMFFCLSGCPSVWLSVCPSCRMEHLAYIRRVFVKYLNIFLKYVDDVQALLQSDTNNGYSTWRPVYTYDNIWLSFSKNEKCFAKFCRGNRGSHFTSRNLFPKIVAFMWYCGRMWYSQTDHRRQYYTAHAHYMLLTKATNMHAE